MNAFAGPADGDLREVPPAFVDRNRPWFVATSSVSAAGMTMRFTPRLSSAGFPL